MMTLSSFSSHQDIPGIFRENYKGVTDTQRDAAKCLQGWMSCSMFLGCSRRSVRYSLMKQHADLITIQWCVFLCLRLVGVALVFDAAIRCEIQLIKEM